MHAHDSQGTTVLRFDNAPKKATNLTLNAKVLEMARELGMNVSQTVDALLAEEVRRRYWERWNADNKGAIDAYNERIERDGLPLAKYRSFAKGR
jgi:antitoxin CcdA